MSSADEDRVQPRLFDEKVISERQAPEDVPETELERVLASKARLIRGFAHDIKNPLGAASGRAELMLEGVIGDVPEAMRPQLEGIRRSLKAALELVDTLVEFTRVEAGQIELERKQLQLGSLTRQVAEEHNAAAQQKGLELVIDDRAAPAITSDDARVRQILHNLLANAVKYTTAGTVRVIVESASDEERSTQNMEAAVRVTDTGRGIPADRMHELFIEFTRIDPIDGSGAGLGLAISRRLARLLGGDISVQSEAGNGSTFSLLLP